MQDAFGRVYMGMNLDSGELLAVKQVLIAENSSSKEKQQAHIKELEEEVKLLKNLSHPNIVRYLGTVREEENLNIFLEFVPGGSISSLLGKFGPFPEAVIRTYTKQPLVGLDYLHSNGIMHQDIKGANILVDNKGQIKLAAFGASKQVVELATVTGAKSMKGTPYWMAPEVIRQTGHSFSADIWSVGCTVIEMVTGKPPWSEQYKEVAALFYIGSTKCQLEIPEHLSPEAKIFLLQCLLREPNMRPTASELLQDHSDIPSPMHTNDLQTHHMSTHSGSTDGYNLGTPSCIYVDHETISEGKRKWGTDISDDDMCQMDSDSFVTSEVKRSSHMTPNDFKKSFDPMCELSHDWTTNFDESAKLEQTEKLDSDQPVPTQNFAELENNLSVSCGESLTEDDDELTASKIRAFLGKKALELKKLQTPLYEEFYNSLNPSCSPSFVQSVQYDETSPSYLRLPPKSRSPNRFPVGSPSATIDAASTRSPGSNSRLTPDISNTNNQTTQDNSSPQCNDPKSHPIDQPELNSPCASFSERQRKWKEELDQELERKRGDHICPRSTVLPSSKNLM